MVSIYIIGGPSEDPRATRGGDTEEELGLNCERFVSTSAATSGEVGRSQIEKYTTWGDAPNLCRRLRVEDKREDYRKYFVEWFVLHSPVIDHVHYAGKWLSNGRVHCGLQYLQSPLAVFILSCITRHGSVQRMVGRCGSHR